MNSPATSPPAADPPASQAPGRQCRRRRGPCALRQCPATGADRRPVPARKPRRMPWKWPPPCRSLPAASASASSSRHRSTRRTAPRSPRSAASGLRSGLPMLAEVRDGARLPVLTDVHAPEQCAPVAEAVDVLQIPAFLCRQTDLLLAAAATGRAINVKKGQFLAPWDMQQRRRQDRRQPATATCLLTERGVSFGYNTLVADMRALPIMARAPATRWCSTPPIRCSSRAGRARPRGGQRAFAPVLARAAVAVGVAAVFIETHPDPDTRALRRPQHGPAHADGGAGRRADGLRCARQAAAG